MILVDECQNQAQISRTKLIFRCNGITLEITRELFGVGSNPADWGFLAGCVRLSFVLKLRLAELLCDSERKLAETRSQFQNQLDLEAGFLRMVMIGAWDEYSKELIIRPKLPND